MLLLSLRNFDPFLASIVLNQQPCLSLSFLALFYTTLPLLYYIAYFTVTTTKTRKLTKPTKLTKLTKTLQNLFKTT